MKNLVIGNTSQLSNYFPDDYEKISSRDIEYSDKKYDSIYLCLGEQRTHLNDRDLFFDVHVDHTVKILKHYTKMANKVVIYGTSDLWNNCNGPIDVTTPYNYKQSKYVDSKRVMLEIVNQLFPNVIILHPFDFISINLKDYHLINKVIKSIINEEKIIIGDTHYYTELLHPKFVVEKSIEATSSGIIGSGRLIYLNDFIKGLYSYFSLDYNDFVTEEYDKDKDKNIFYLKSKQVLYNNIHNDTIREIENFRPLKKL